MSNGGLDHPGRFRIDPCMFSSLWVKLATGKHFVSLENLNWPKMPSTDRMAISMFHFLENHEIIDDVIC